MQVKKDEVKESSKKEEALNKNPTNKSSFNNFNETSKKDKEDAKLLEKVSVGKFIESAPISPEKEIKEDVKFQEKMEKYIIKTDIIQENNENELEKIVEIEEEGANEKNKENTDTNYHNNETKNYEKNNINNANAINVNKNASVAFKDRVKFMEIKKSEDKIKHFQAEPKKEEKPVDSNAPHKNTISEKEEKYLKRALKNRKDKKKEDEIIHHSSKISSFAGTLENQLFKKRSLINQK